MRKHLAMLVSALLVLAGIGVAVAPSASAVTTYTTSDTCLDAPYSANAQGYWIWGYPITISTTWEEESGHPTNVRPRTTKFTFNNPTPSRSGLTYWHGIRSVEFVEYVNHSFFTDVAVYGAISNQYTWTCDAYYVSSPYYYETRTFIAKSLHPQMIAQYDAWDASIAEWTHWTCVLNG